MIAGNFELLNVEYSRKGGGHWVFLKGEIFNNSSRTYTSAVFKLSVFEHTHLLWTGPLRVRNFKKRHTRPFELQMETLRAELIPRISKCELFFESGY
jgi:hypothetical protein